MKILYFASLKENLNTSDEDLAFKSPVKISTIKKELIQKVLDIMFALCFPEVHLHKGVNKGCMR